MNENEFRRWMKRNTFTRAAAAEALGLSLRQIAYYMSGESDIPKVVSLACQWIDHISQEKRK